MAFISAVDQHLLDLHAVGLHRGQRVGQFEPQRNRAALSSRWASSVVASQLVDAE